VCSSDLPKTPKPHLEYEESYIIINQISHCLSESEMLKLIDSLS